MYDYDLLVVGSANADLVIGVERRPGAGETVLGSDLAVHPGGKGANQAVAAARLGARTALLARVGDDSYGRLLLDSQRTAGVDTVGVLVGGAPTGVALITVDPSGDNSIVVSPGANGKLTSADVTAAACLFQASRVVSTQLEIPLETVVEVVRSLTPDSRFVLNPSPPQPLPPEVLAACDPLIVNEHEAKVVLGDTCVSDRPEDWARLLLAKGPRSVVVTLGAEGALVADGREVTRVPSVKVDAVDTTGAGDAFTAALAFRLGSGASLAEAAAYAARVGAAAVTKEGAQVSFPTAEEAEAVCGGLPEDAVPDGGSAAGRTPGTKGGPDDSSGTPQRGEAL
ncbi:ribokinase [Streptomyces sp. NBC_00078]|uniref:ribokinase n=1 Tax=unclassified Streptomyces TaxID=2593676 RepID=UPI00224D2ADB|nr:ribokinase [Streptomyces sp. NBC_00078]MCX5420983.1 ribokinase [Streptomyces sp. NBC_00078]